MFRRRTHPADPVSDVPAVDPADFTPEAIAKLAPECGTCGPRDGIKLVRGSAVYGRRPDLHDKWFWWCPCGNYCGTHAGTLKALGKPANAETRAARSAAHEAFDPMWRRKMERDGVTVHKARGAGYKWLAAQMGIDRKDCHIGAMSLHDARRVVDICSRYRR